MNTASLVDFCNSTDAVWPEMSCADERKIGASPHCFRCVSYGRSNGLRTAMWQLGTAITSDEGTNEATREEMRETAQSVFSGHHVNAHSLPRLTHATSSFTAHLGSNAPVVVFTVGVQAYP